MMFGFGAESGSEPVLGSGLVPGLGLLCLGPGLGTGLGPGAWSVEGYRTGLGARAGLGPGLGQLKGI